MRISLIGPTLASLFLAGCVAAPLETSPQISRTWMQATDGEVFSVGYFSEEQLRDRRWEATRLRSKGRVKACNHSGSERRDVRWIDKTSEGGGRCALVVYSYSCPDLKPREGVSTDYFRAEILGREIEDKIESTCASPLPMNDAERQLANEQREKRKKTKRKNMISREARCSSQADSINGQIRILTGTRFSEEIKVSPEIANRLRDGWIARSPKTILKLAAQKTNKVHAFFSTKNLPNDETNILLKVVVAEKSDGEPYCVTLEARQGKAIWRKTLTGTDLKSTKGALPGERGFSPSGIAPDGDVDFLTYELSKAIGLPDWRPNARK